MTNEDIDETMAHINALSEIPNSLFSIEVGTASLVLGKFLL